MHESNSRLDLVLSVYNRKEPRLHLHYLIIITIEVSSDCSTTLMLSGLHYVTNSVGVNRSYNVVLTSMQRNIVLVTL